MTDVERLILDELRDIKDKVDANHESLHEFKLKVQGDISNASFGVIKILITIITSVVLSGAVAQLF